MKKVFMSLAIIAAMFAAASCACNNNSQPDSQPAEEQCSSCDEECEACDSTSSCCNKAE